LRATTKNRFDATAKFKVACAGRWARRHSISVDEATDLLRGAVTEAQATNEEMAGLARSAQEIGDVVQLIQQIAVLSGRRCGGDPQAFSERARQRRRHLDSDDLGGRTMPVVEDMQGHLDVSVYGLDRGQLRGPEVVRRRPFEIHDHDAALEGTLATLWFQCRFEFEVPMMVLPRRLIGTSNSPH
jgi:hypothetical protein